MRVVPLNVGEPAPWFACRTRSKQRFVFDTVGGRYVVISFFGSAAHPAATQLLQDIHAHRSRFDYVQASFFGVSVDPEDEQRERVGDSLPGQ